MRKWGRSIALAFVAMFATPFAFAYDVCRPVFVRVFTEQESFGKAESQFKAELVANYQGRTSEAGRAHGLFTESNGFRMANIFKATSLPFEVGWRKFARV